MATSTISPVIGANLSKSYLCRTTQKALDNQKFHQHNVRMLSAAVPSEDPASFRPTDAESVRAFIPLSWKLFLVQEQPHRLVPIVFAFALVATCSVLSFHTLWVGIAACLALAGVIKEFILPQSYSLDSVGASVKCGPVTWIEMPWEQVKSVYRTPAGLKLSPYASPKTARLEPLRGVTLRFPRSMITEVERTVDQLWNHSKETTDESI